GVTAPAKEEVKNSTGGNVQTQIETQTEPATTEKIESAVVPIPFTSTTENNPGLAQGQTQIKQAGQNGSKEVKTKITYVDGKETKREVVSATVTTQPVPQITSVGTYVAPPPAPAPNPTPAPDTSGVPSGATAKCNDGTYSYSANHSGTCSHHGGVAEWYR
ncbi:MAG: G5 domain-containing protein, partial [Thermoleophilia bacterium]